MAKGSSDWGTKESASGARSLMEGPSPASEGSLFCAAFWAAISSAVKNLPPGPRGRRIACLWRDSWRYGFGEGMRKVGAERKGIPCAAWKDDGALQDERGRRDA